MKEDDIQAIGALVIALLVIVVACVVGTIRLGMYCMTENRIVLGALIIMAAIVFVLVCALKQLKK